MHLDERHLAVVVVVDVALDSWQEDTAYEPTAHHAIGPPYLRELGNPAENGRYFVCEQILRVAVGTPPRIFCFKASLRFLK
jgi:hypothetical protein